MSYSKGASDPGAAGTRACSAALSSLSIQIYGAAILEDPVLGAEEGTTKPCGSTACIVSTARRENEQKSDISGRSKCSALIITLHDFAGRAHACYCKKLAPGAARRRTTEGGTALTGPKLGGPLLVVFITSAT